jgi:hypothetical protein
LAIAAFKLLKGVLLVVANAAIAVYLIAHLKRAQLTS